MLDDSLTAGRIEQPRGPESPTVTIGDSLDDLTISGDLGDDAEHKQLAVDDRFAGFIIRSVLGRGALGVVYEAWDPSHERRVTLKLLRSPTRRAAERLLRDARALARLDHPGVVRIWAADVHRGAVYLAMELVEGQNLRDWMAAPRSWGEVLPLMISVAQGLAAAHAAGVIHGDVTPENILVGWDGRAQVLDFGIARVAAEYGLDCDKAGPLIASGDELSAGEASCGADPLTGSFAALPIMQPRLEALRYAAPEQHELERADEHADQFSYCVTLFEVLYGDHPFPASTVEELARRVAARDVELPSGHPDIPRWIERVIHRGLSPARDDRFGTMEDLIEALERHPGRRRRRNRALVVGAVALGAVGLGVMVPRASAVDPCLERSASALDAGLSESQREELADHLAGLGLGASPALATQTRASLDDWAQGWSSARVEACRARRQHREATTLDRTRAACLDGALAEVGALVEVASAAAPATAGAIERGLTALPDPAACLAQPPAPWTLAGVEAIVAELERLRWLTRLGGGDEQVQRRAEQLVASVASVEAVASSPEAGEEATRLRAHALVILGRAELAEGAYAAAQEHLREAARAAERSGDDDARARAMIELGRALALTPGRGREAIAVLDDAEALLDRLDPEQTDGPARRGHDRALGRALLASRELERAATLLEATLRELDGEALRELDGAQVRLGLAELADLLDEGEGGHERAAQLAREALDIYASHLGEDHDDVAAASLRLGLALAHRGADQLGAAREALARAEAIRRGRHERRGSELDRRRLGEVILARASVEAEHGDGAAAVSSYRELLSLAAEDDDATRGVALLALGDDHRAAARLDQALANYEQALRHAERALDLDGPVVLGARLGVGMTLLALDRPAEARAPLRRSLADWPLSRLGTGDEADLRFALAQALAALDGWGAEAEELAVEASAIYLRVGATDAASAVEAWLAAQRGSP